MQRLRKRSCVPLPHYGRGLRFSVLKILMLCVGPFAKDEALLWNCYHGDCLPSAASRSLITLSTEYSDFVDQITLIIMLAY